MNHFLFITHASALTEGQSPSMKYIDTFPSYSKALSFIKSDTGLLKSIGADNKEPCFLIIPEKNIVFARPAQKEKLKVIPLSAITQELSTPEPDGDISS